MQGRDEKGKFAQKSDEPRHVRSIRATDPTWELMGELANKRGITRADLLEEMVINQKGLDEAIPILEESLTLKANAGGAIKKRIREVLDLLNN